MAICSQFGIEFGKVHDKYKLARIYIHISQIRVGEANLFLDMVHARDVIVEASGLNLFIIKCSSYAPLSKPCTAMPPAFQGRCEAHILKSLLHRFHRLRHDKS